MSPRGLRQFTWSSEFAVPARELFDWHRSEEAFERLIPPWEPVEMVDRTGGIEDEGSEVVLEISPVWPIQLQWVSRHQNYVDGEQFQDVQVRGPFAHWTHTHRVESVDADRSRLVDDIEYALPLRWISHPLVGWYVDRRLRRMFTYRHRVTREALE